MPRALYELLSQGHKVYVSLRPIEAATDRGPKALPAGTLIAPVAGDEKVHVTLRKLVERDALQVFATASGQTLDGPDLGSPSVRALTLPRPLLLVGRGVSTYEAGEAWHLMDFRHRMELPMVELDQVAGLDLGAYTHLVMVDGNYDRLDSGAIRKLRRWVRAGGTVVATKRATEWVERNLQAADLPDGDSGGSSGGDGGESDSEPEIGRYADYSAERAKQLVSGAILEAEIDLSHPLAFGLQSESIALFRTRSRPMSASENPYENVALYTDSPRVSGYVSPRNQTRLAGTAAVTAARVGEGTVVRLADNPYFRAYWLGPSRLLMNALFFGQILDSRQPPSRWDEEE